MQVGEVGKLAPEPLVIAVHPVDLAVPAHWFKVVDDRYDRIDHIIPKSTPIREPCAVIVAALTTSVADRCVQPQVVAVQNGKVRQNANRLIPGLQRL